MSFHFGPPPPHRAHPHRPLCGRGGGAVAEEEEEDAYDTSNYSEGGRGGRGGRGWQRVACRWLGKFALVAALTAVLVLTYEHCIVCVVCVCVFSLATLNCIPLMPLVFALSVAILVWHSVDVQRSTVRVEIPLNNLIYVPTLSDFEQYVHFQPGAPPASAAPDPPPRQTVAVAPRAY
jgi:hypothetical protein